VAVIACASASASSRSFRERFVWRGVPAASVADGNGSTVWWNRDDWDVRGDTHAVAVQPFNDAWHGFHIDIHKAGSRSPGSGAENNSVFNPGGDGSPGVGIMHLDFQGILSARLRRPVLISRRRPGSISFWAPRFATTGHWWEIAISPLAQGAIGGEYTAVPGRQDSETLPSPLSGLHDGGATNGPGHRQYTLDSINLVSTGWPDIPNCANQAPQDRIGWFTRWGVTKAVGGRVRDFVNPRGSVARLVRTSPNERTRLFHWKVLFYPDRLRLLADFSGKGVFRSVEQWRVRVPWSEVYVYLLYAAYQADHHPQANCGLGEAGVGQIEELAWRDVQVSPTKYSRTWTLPRGGESAAQIRDGGWMSYDLRDIQRHSSLRGLEAPNLGPYDEFQSYRYCSIYNGGGIVCGDPARAPTRQVNLRPRLTRGDLRRLAHAQIVADLRYPGSVRVTVNDHPVGVLPRVPEGTSPSPSGAAFEPQAWVRRSLTIPVHHLHTGVNTVQLDLDQQHVEVDRIELELARR
jgi:hypothetical protein